MTELPLDQVRTLLAVVDEGTFDAAAAALHVTPSAISQRVKALEQRTGRVLLVRAKPVRVTDDGRRVVRFARQIALLEQETRAELGLTGESEQVRLPIAVNADSLASWFPAALAAVPTEARIAFELHREDEEYTATLLREGLVMAAVTSSPVAVAGCTVRKLGSMRYLAVAAPEFRRRWLVDGTESSLRQGIQAAPVVVFDRQDVLQDRFVRKIGRNLRAGTPRHYIPSSEGFADAVAGGVGWGMMPTGQARTRLADGSLVELGPRRWIDVPLYWQQWKLDSPAIALVAAAVADTAAVALDGPRGRASRG